MKKQQHRKHCNGNVYNSRQIKHSVDKDCEWWVDYDRRGNIIHKKTVFNNGIVVEYWVEYNNSNHETHFKRNDGFQYWCTYNKKGNISKYWDTFGLQENYYYYHNIVYKKDNQGNVVKRTFVQKPNGYLTIHNF